MLPARVRDQAGQVKRQDSPRLRGIHLGLEPMSRFPWSSPRRPIYDFQHAVERLAAAAEAARTLPFPFVLVGRAENFLHGRPDLDDTIRRLQAFEAVGANALYAPGLTRPQDIRIVCTAVSKPVNVVMGLKTVSLSVADLAALGVRRISLGSALSRAALGAFLRAARDARVAAIKKRFSYKISPREAWRSTEGKLETLHS